MGPTRARRGRDEGPTTARRRPDDKQQLNHYNNSDHFNNSRIQPPPNADQVEPSQDEWAEVVARLSSLGVGKSRDAVHQARSAGLSPHDVKQICDHFQANLTGTHEAGALYLRLCEAVPSLPPDQGWPPVKSSASSASGDPAAVAWGNVLRASKIWTRYDPGKCQEARNLLTSDESRAVDSIGGFAKIQNCETSQTHFFRNEFVKAYHASAQEAVG